MNIRSSLVAMVMLVMTVTTCVGQEEEKKDKPSVDPASASETFEKTMGKIRNVEQLEKFIQENTQLKGENAGLKGQVKTLNGQVNSLTQQVNKLTQELQTQNAKIRKQLLELPSFVVKSKLVRGEDSVAILQFGEKSIRIRNKLELSVPVKDGVWITMKVEKIEREIIQLSFPELERTLLIYD